MRSFVPTSERHWNDVPWPLRLLGIWGLERGLLRAKWGEISWRRFGLSLRYSVYHDTAHFNIQLFWPSIHIKAPMLITQRPGTEDWCATYGFSTFEGAIHLNWRLRCKIIYMPWTWGTAVRHSVFNSEGGKQPYIPEYGKDRGPFKDGRWVEQHPFIYVLRSGEIQHRIATIYGEEMEWRLCYTPWLPWPRLVRRTIAINFDDEVGEGTGSWKGGVLGCSTDWRDGETMRGALQRMQHTREFK